MNTFRIHGDNIVECERIANIIINTVAPDQSSPKKNLTPRKSNCLVFNLLHI